MVEIELQFDSIPPFLGIHPNDSIAYFTDACSIMFIVSVFSIARKGAQPSGSLTVIE